MRFHALVFAGDDAARSIYAAFNILLTNDLELGAWRIWEMELVHKKKCRCEAMFALAKGGTGPLEECGMFELTGTHQLGDWPTHMSSDVGPILLSCIFRISRS